MEENGRAEHIAALMAAAITAGLKETKPALDASMCEVSGVTSGESALLTLMATRARLMALEIVLMQSGVLALGVDYERLSELIFEVRRGTLAAHILSKIISKYDGQKMFPELNIEEVLDSNWENAVKERNLVKALKAISSISKGVNGKNLSFLK